MAKHVVRQGISLQGMRRLPWSMFNVLLHTHIHTYRNKYYLYIYFPLFATQNELLSGPAEQLKCNVFTIFCLSPSRCFNYAQPFPTVPAHCTCADARASSPFPLPFVRYVLSMASGFDVVVVVVVAIFVFSMYLNCHKYQSKSNAHQAQQREWGREWEENAIDERALSYVVRLCALTFFRHLTLCVVSGSSSN